MTTMFNLSFAACLLAMATAFVVLFTKNKVIRTINFLLMVSAVGTLTLYIILRWIEAERAPFSNMFESLVLFAWTMMAVFLFLRARIKLPILGAATALLAVLTLAYAATYGADIKPLVPALQSNWLTVHVFSCFLGYGGFAISFLASITYLVAVQAGRFVSDETTGSLEVVTAKTVSFGFLFLTIGIITGAVWANSAWGTYWSWDPKETWSLITWLIYAAYLHCRYMKGWRGRRAAWMSIAGFLSVLFTYFGVNFFLSGLHSYA